MSAALSTVWPGCSLVFIGTTVCSWLIGHTRRTETADKALASNGSMVWSGGLLVITGYGTQLALNTHGSGKFLILLSYLSGIGLSFLLCRCRKS